MMEMSALYRSHAYCQDTCQLSSVCDVWITEQKNFLLLRNWVHFVPIFLKLFSQLFFHGSINKLN
jgi:hypothetical protein